MRDFYGFLVSNFTFNCLWKPPLVVFEHAGSWTGFELEGQNAAAAAENQLQLQQSPLSASATEAAELEADAGHLNHPLLDSQLLPPPFPPFLPSLTLPSPLCWCFRSTEPTLTLSTSLDWMQISAVASASLTARLRGSFAGRLRRRIRTASSSSTPAPFSCHTTAQTTDASPTAAASKDSLFQIKPENDAKTIFPHHLVCESADLLKKREYIRL